MGEVVSFEDDPWITLYITTEKGHCELELNHSEREYPSTTTMEITPKQAIKIAKVLSQWAREQEGV